MNGVGRLGRRRVSGTRCTVGEGSGAALPRSTGLRKIGAVRGRHERRYAASDDGDLRVGGLSQAEEYSRKAQRRKMAAAGIHTLAQRPAGEDFTAASETAGR